MALRAVGNINVLNRPIVLNEDGSISTTLSFSVNIDGLEVLLPMIVGGRKLTQSEAVAHYISTGEHLGVFDTPSEADRYADQLHNFQVTVLRQQGLLTAATQTDSGAGK